MRIDQPKNLNTPNLQAAGSQAVAKLPIPKSSQQINANSLKWLAKLGSSISDRIMSSIKSGQLFKIAEFGPNRFATPAFTEQGQTHRPVLQFEPGHDEDLYLVGVAMQTPKGQLNTWASAPGANAFETPPASSDRPNGNHASPSRYAPPGANRSLTSIGLALSGGQQTSTKRSESFPSDRRHAGQEIPASLLPGMVWPAPPSPTIGQFSSLSHAALRDVPDALRPGLGRQMGSDQTNARDANSSLLAASALSAAHRPYAAPSSLTEPKYSAPSPISNSKPRLSREAYEARINRNQNTLTQLSDQATAAPNVNNKNDDYLANSVKSLMNHQQEMQDAQALLTSEPDSYSKPRLSREAFEAKLNDKG